MDDGAQLLDLGAVQGQLALRSNATTTTPLVYTPSAGGAPSSIVLRFNGILENAGSIPMIGVPSGSFFVLAIVANGTLLVPGSAPIVDVGVGGILILGCLGVGSVPNNWASGGPTATLLYQNVGGLPSPLPVNAGFAGSTIQNVLFGASCTGPATRPINPFGPLGVGTTVFDQSLGATGIPIWWDGAQWVDATGAPV